MKELSKAISEKAQIHLKTLQRIRVKKEAISDTIMFDLTDDMYCGSLPADTILDFNCLICYGIAMNPVKCHSCSAMVCQEC